MVVGCRYETASVVTANGTQIETAAAGAMGDTVRLENVSAADTGAKTFADTMNAAENKDKFSKMGFTPERLSPAEFAKFVQAEHTKYGALIKSASIKID